MLIEFRDERVPTGGVGIGGCVDVVRSGAFLYALNGRDLVVLSLDDPAMPKPVGRLAGMGNLRQVVVRGTTAFVTAREDGLFIVDVSDPCQPRMVCHYDTVELATGIDVRDGFAFIACRWFGVEIVDVLDAARPRHIASVRVGEAQSCVVSDGYLYVGAWEERRVAICDVRDPASPRQVATVGLGGRGDGVAVHDGVLYAATGHHQPGAALRVDDPRYGSGNGMDVFDVSDPCRPQHLSRVDFDWRFYYGWPDTWRVTVSYPRVYLSHTYNGVFVLDMSVPEAPELLGQIRIPVQRGEKGYRELSMKSVNGLRPPILPFDPMEMVYSPVCGVVATDGYLYLPGLFSDLHVFEDQALATKASAPGPSGLRRSATRPVGPPAADLDAARKCLAAVSRDVAHYHCPEGQIYAAVETDGLVYAACGAGGIRVLDQGLRLLTSYGTDGFAMDVQVVGEHLFVAECSGGMACYCVRGTALELVGHHVCTGPVKQVRVTSNGRFAVLHVGGATYEVLDVRDASQPQAVRTERGWGGMVYYRQLCNGFVAGRYTCGTWCAGRTFMLDLGGEEPLPMPDVTGVLPDMETGGYCPCGPYALLTREGGYTVFEPGYSGSYEELPVHRLPDGVVFRGKPSCCGDLLVACDRIAGDVVFLDVSRLTEPRLLCRFASPGNPDCAFVGDAAVLIPAGYGGLFRIGLDRVGDAQ